MRTLYNKYAPNNWDELLGQDIAKTILKGLIESDVIPNGMLFHGPSGTGKTSAARLFAKIILNNKENVIEIDGAQNNGVEYMKTVLLEQLRYTPTDKYTIVIIDEVHMLSRSAFDALLTFLQDPYPHVIFVFVTTREDKIPETIQSRCLLIPFFKIVRSKLIDILNKIQDKEKLKISKENQEFLIRKSGGNLRKLLSTIDGCRHLTGSWSKQMKNFTKEEMETLFIWILEGKLREAMECWQEYEDAGYSEQNFYHALSEVINDISTDILLQKDNPILKKYDLSNSLVIGFWDIIVKSELFHSMGIPKTIPMCIKKLISLDDSISLIGYARKMLNKN